MLYGIVTSKFLSISCTKLIVMFMLITRINWFNSYIGGGVKLVPFGTRPIVLAPGDYDEKKLVE
jgi:hypothetical protein